MTHLVTVVMPTIPARGDTLLRRAVHSVQEQTIGFDHLDLFIISDPESYGPAKMRNIGIYHADTKWVAFLDDDDEMHPHHLHSLLSWAEDRECDVVYPWFDWVVEGEVLNWKDPLRTRTCASPLGAPFDRDGLLERNYIPVTTLVRRELLLDVGGFVTPEEFDGPEDWGTWLRLLGAGAEFEHLPDRTWMWHQHDGQTGGRP